MTSLDILGNVQPGMTAEKRPAVPPATTNFRLAGSRNFGMSVESVSGCGNLAMHVSGQALAAVHAGDELAHRLAQPVPEELPHVGLAPAVAGDGARVLGREDHERVAVVGGLAGAR